MVSTDPLFAARRLDPAGAIGPESGKEEQRSRGCESAFRTASQDILGVTQVKSPRTIRGGVVGLLLALAVVVVWGRFGPASFTA